MPYDHLTGTEVDRSHAAASYLLDHADHLRLEPVMIAKLSTLRSDLTVEQEERRKLASR